MWDCKDKMVGLLGTKSHCLHKARLYWKLSPLHLFQKGLGVTWFGLWYWVSPCPHLSYAKIWTESLFDGLSRHWVTYCRIASQFVFPIWFWNWKMKELSVHGLSTFAFIHYSIFGSEIKNQNYLILVLGVKGIVKHYSVDSSFPEAFSSALACPSPSSPHAFSHWLTIIIVEFLRFKAFIL